MARSISAAVSLNEAGDQLSNFFDSSRTATSLRASISARMCSTVSRTLASAALIALASIPRLRCLATTLLLVMAGLDPAIHAAFVLVEALYGPPGQARG